MYVKTTFIIATCAFDKSLLSVPYESNRLCTWEWKFTFDIERHCSIRRTVKWQKPFNQLMENDDLVRLGKRSGYSQVYVK